MIDTVLTGMILAQAETTEPAVRFDWGETLRQTTWTGWGVLLACIFAGVLAGRVAQGVLRGLSTRWLARGWTIRGTFFADAANPASLFLITLGLSIGLTPIVMSPDLRDYVGRAVALLYILALAWFAYNLVDLADVGLRRLTSRTKSKLDDQVVPLVRKAVRIFLVVVFALFVAENIFGADITAWLAGLGIAGLAVSLAAQDSIKNLFGSITIILDKPFAVGDRINFAGYDGMVEEIGFRSTKVRTLAGHVVTIPNSKIVDGSVENIQRRPNIRRIANITITYDTPPEKIEQAVQVIRDILAEPEIASAFDMVKFPPRISFSEFNADSLNIFVIYWFQPADYWAYLEHAQKFNLRLVRAFEQAGIDFAFPTRTLYLAGDEKRELAVRLLSADSGGS